MCRLWEPSGVKEKIVVEIQMKKVLCVANFLFGSASGAQSLARTHVKALYQAFGKENVIVFALVGTEEVADQKDIQVKKVVNKLPIRLINLLKGNTGKINSEIISEIIETINRENVELFFLDDSIYGNAIRIIKKYCPEVKVASFYHDIKRYLAVEWAKKNPKSIPVQISLVSNERKTARYADVNIVLNKREEKLFQKYYHKSPEMLLPIILPTPKLSSRIDSDKCNILFVGGYYYPNVNGFRWFIKNVTPLIKINYEVTLVGNRMDLLKEEFSNNSNVKVLGRVEDLSPYYEDADVVVGPIFEGAGMKVKTAEALSYGKIFIGTDESLIGYKELAGNLLGKSIIVCNNEEEFAKAINNLDFGNGFCPENYDFFLRNYSIEAATCKLKTLLE